MLYKMAMPMLTMNNTGAIYESRSSIIASSDSKTATVTYLTSSCSQIFFKSSTRGDKPDIYACLSLTFLICSTALSVLSSDVELLKNTTIMLASLFDKFCATLSGSIDFGTVGSSTSSRFKTSSTPSILL